MTLLRNTKCYHVLSKHFIKEFNTARNFTAVCAHKVICPYANGESLSRSSSDKLYIHSKRGQLLTSTNHGCQYTCTRGISRQFYESWLSPANPPIGYAQQLLESVHDISGLPWWASIALATFTLRTIVTLPFSVYAAKNMGKVESLQPELKETALELKKEVAMAMRRNKWDEKTAKYQFRINMKRIIKEAYVQENCHPAKSTIVAWVQLPMWISISLALRNMAGGFTVDKAETSVLVPDLANEGTLWFTNLVLQDTTLILPVTLGLLNLLIIEMHALKAGEPSKFQKALTNLLRGLSLVMIPIGAVVPSCMCWYWTCSSIYGLTQNVLMKLPTVRRTLGIPKVPSESDTPFQDMYAVAKLKFRRKGNGKVE